jgi:hypothetical protein
MNLFLKGVTRKDVITKLLVLPALASALLTSETTIARADSRDTLKYQSTPKDGLKCLACTLFVPGKSTTADGSCKVITGAISPNGWCTAFSKRPA